MGIAIRKECPIKKDDVWYDGDGNCLEKACNILCPQKIPKPISGIVIRF